MFVFFLVYFYSTIFFFFFSQITKTKQTNNNNNKIKNGATPLWAACSSGNIEFAEVLVKHGADVNAKNNVCFSFMFISLYLYLCKDIELEYETGTMFFLFSLFF